MRIYVAHASSFDFCEELYRPLKESSLWAEHTFILPHAIDKSVEDSSRPVIESCDMVLAEVSFPSTGLGIELGWAFDMGKPIECIYREGSRYSPSLTLVSGGFSVYRSEELIKIIEKSIIKTRD